MSLAEAVAALLAELARINGRTVDEEAAACRTEGSAELEQRWDDLRLRIGIAVAASRHGLSPQPEPAKAAEPKAEEPKAEEPKADPRKVRHGTWDPSVELRKA